ncbi:MAG: di-trans,poly-cis-decaprenylcistransferase, partial [Proteobacteria bacterium]
TENWKRPKREIDTLMLLLRTYLKQAESMFHENRVRFEFIGDVEPLSDAMKDALQGLRLRTARHSKTTLILAINYSGQQDIAQAAKRLQLASETITCDSIEQSLQTSAYGPVDLLLRTGGENRISNFFLWQSAYAEIHFLEKYWPDFKPDDLEDEVRRFAVSERRFGGLSKTS